MTMYTVDCDKIPRKQTSKTGSERNIFLSDSADGRADCLTNPADVPQYGNFPRVRLGWSGH